MPNKPYIISPEEFGESGNYTQISLTYTLKEFWQTTKNEIIEDIDDTVGEDFADHFGDYEDDSVFVRNDRLRCDYEILKDNRSYHDVAGIGLGQED